ncbi:uroporphyrinogen decarboxylase [Aureivirga sp. CE67]|uniref:uroporphyrinogen decarboxylase n=1 Tax=Aureivirga sp. CE67 TaxID=1788983 RepID=UPI0018CAED75|nr:uroporphyrinogen decarboxylase [Aureivirga sp. CE67]
MNLDISYVEMVGYLASVLLIIAFTLKNIRSLRIVNTLGCFTFMIYGVMLDIAWPIVITNAFIFITNLYYLFLKKRVDS